MLNRLVVVQAVALQRLQTITASRLLFSTTAAPANAQLLNMILRASQWKANATGALEKSYTFKNERNATTFLSRRELSNQNQVFSYSSFSTFRTIPPPFPPPLFLPFLLLFLLQWQIRICN